MHAEPLHAALSEAEREEVYAEAAASVAAALSSRDARGAPRNGVESENEHDQHGADHERRRLAADRRDGENEGEGDNVDERLQRLRARYERDAQRARARLSRFADEDARALQDVLTSSRGARAGLHQADALLALSHDAFEELPPESQQLLAAYGNARRALAASEQLIELEEEAADMARVLRERRHCTLREMDERIVVLVKRRAELERALRAEAPDNLDALLRELHRRTGGDLEALVTSECKRRVRECLHLARSDPSALAEAVQALERREAAGVDMAAEGIRAAVSDRAVQCEAEARAKQQAERASAASDGTSAAPGQPAVPPPEWVREALAELPTPPALPHSSRGQAAPRQTPSADASDEVSSLGKHVIAVADILVEELTFFADDIEPMFPPRYKALELFAAEVSEVLNALLWYAVAHAASFTGKDVLALVSWIEEYHAHLDVLLPPSQLSSASATSSSRWSSPPAAASKADEADSRAPAARGTRASQRFSLNGPSARLAEGYAYRALEMMKRWVSNCLDVDSKALIDVNEDDGTLYTKAPFDVFRIVNDEIAIVSEHAQRGNPLFVQLMCDACAAALLEFRAQSAQRLDGIEADDGALERVCAATNNHRRCAEMVPQFASRCRAVLSRAVAADSAGGNGSKRQSGKQRDALAGADKFTFTDERDGAGEAADDHDDDDGSGGGGGGDGVVHRRRSSASASADDYPLRIERLASEFHQSAEMCAAHVCNVIFLDLNEAPGLWPRLFSHGWECGEEEIAGSVIATVSDFFQDIEEFMQRDQDRQTASMDCAWRIGDVYLVEAARRIGAGKKSSGSGGASSSSSVSVSSSGGSRDAAGGSSGSLTRRILGDSGSTGGGSGGSGSYSIGIGASGNSSGGGGTSLISSRLLRRGSSGIDTSDGSGGGGIGGAGAGATDRHGLRANRPIAARLRTDRELYADYFLDYGSGAQVTRCLVALDALADLLSANNVVAVSEAYASLLRGCRAPETAEAWMPPTVERLLQGAAVAPFSVREAVLECRRVWRSLFESAMESSSSSSSMTTAD